MLFKSLNETAAKTLKRGGIGIIPTDTIYGIVGSALNKKTVAKIYRLRKRNSKKPMIILIGKISDLKKFGISPYPKPYTLNPKSWPPRTSIIFPCQLKKFLYLHRGANSLAFRLPKPKKLRTFLKKTGPIVAPSANLEGHSPAKTIKESQKYFGDKIDFYIDAGRLKGKPSRLLKIINNKTIELRS